MNTHADKTQKNKSQSVANAVSQKQSGGESTFQFEDNRHEAVAQQKLQEMANNSPQVSQLKVFQEMADNSPQAKKVTQLEEITDNRNSKIQSNNNDASYKASSKPVQLMSPGEENMRRRAAVFADSGPITAEERGPSPVDGFMSNSGGLESSEIADSAIFDNSTKMADATAVASGAAKGLGMVSETAKAGMGVADALPGVGVATGVVGVAENVIRGVAAHNRAGIMEKGAEGNETGSRAKAILNMGKEEQSRETKRRVARATGGGAQTGLAIGAIAVGAATAGTGLAIAAGVLGGMKATETLYNMYRKNQGADLSSQHAQQLLFAAQAEDQDVIAALTELGVQTTNLADPVVWQDATKKLSPLMSKATSEFKKMGGYAALSSAEESDDGEWVDNPAYGLEGGPARSE
jgi:hypothetical protein